MRVVRFNYLALLLALAGSRTAAFSVSGTTTTITTTTSHPDATKNGIFLASQRQSDTRVFQSSKPSQQTLTTTTTTTASKSDIQPIDQFDDNDLASSLQTTTAAVASFSYADFAKTYPFANNLLIATTKTAAADLLAQTVISQTPLAEVDLARSFLFCLFGAIYLGGFQYLYQVQIFKKLFDVDRFTSQSWEGKLRDKEGLQALAAQTVLDLTVLTAVYLPTFYIFKASVFSGSLDPAEWLSTGMDNYQMNFVKDETDLIKVWLPADLVCFSVPLYLRLPVRHVVSFVWTAYLSFARGGH